jgi:triacylglycerol lipase
MLEKLKRLQYNLLTRGVRLFFLVLTLTLIGVGIPGWGEECVVLLHGLARTDRSMKDLATALADAGYTTVNLRYPSREKTIEQLAVEVVPEGLRRCREAESNTVHFVTHSMGGILLRYYLSLHPIPEIGRVVMLSPPNQGSAAADAMLNNPVYVWFNGPAGLQLGTGPDGIAASLGPVDFPLGIITGNRAAFYDSWLSDMIPGEDDGKVSVARAKVEGMTDFLVLPYAHSFIMEEEEVISQTLHFLRQGMFRRDDSGPLPSPTPK